MYYAWIRNDGATGFTTCAPNGWHNTGQDPVTFKIVAQDLVWSREFIDRANDLFKTLQGAQHE